MLSVFRYQVLAYLRDPVLLLWTLAFPVIMSLCFLVRAVPEENSRSGRA